MIRSLACLLAATLPASADTAKKPNVLIIMTDDQGLGDFSYTGNPVLKTPNLDAFARASVRLTDFHVAPMCSPTRGQLLTGLAALRNGATSVTAGRTFLRPGLPTMPELFARAGYRTGIFGKWHLGDSYPHRPTDKGFHESAYHLGWGQLHSTPELGWPLIDGRYFHNGARKRYKGHCTDFWFDRATAWMKQCRKEGKPFLCYLPTNAPHGPHVELEEYVKPYRKPGQPAAFFGMIAHIDKCFGVLEKFLADEKLKDDTIVLFMTDNGGTAGVNLFNAGLRGRKTTYYEGGHRVPCWVRWPNGQFGEPRDVKAPTQNTDLLPTLCELCGVGAPKRAKADERFAGVSLAGLLRGAKKALPDRTFVVQYGQVPKKFDCCVVRGKWRLVHGKELYDVEADRAQKKDVAGKHPKIVEAMRDYYEGWWKAVEPTLDDFVPISLGAKQQPVVELTSGDWEGTYADNGGHVREAVGGPTGGHWHVKVERAGTYELILRRWPERAKAALGAAHEPMAKPAPKKAKLKTRAFPAIAAARVEVAGVKAEAKVSPKVTAAALRVKLPAGKTKLKAYFTDAAGKGLCGAFFVTVKPARGL
jgi:arylsulfatase A-like enzyme